MGGATSRADLGCSLGLTRTTALQLTAIELIKVVENLKPKPKPKIQEKGWIGNIFVSVHLNSSFGFNKGNPLRQLRLGSSLQESTSSIMSSELVCFQRKTGLSSF
ncbi:uncharacterized protein LOC130775919 [Actinidia eriantha]|uniref:uncharacterized protein LOC130775919 n=1 Tax=Actinidia eriantha TaxID=165200 RepID=UPI002584E739|nr:uncharacterized protein LOC130775919 [Actinidia eriantha]